MTTRFASLLAAASLGLCATPLLAQDYEHDAPPLPALDEEPAEHDAWGPDRDSEEAVEYEYRGRQDYRPDDRGRRADKPDRMPGHGKHRRQAAEQPSRFAYSDEQREDWLDRCRSNQSYSDNGRERGALIGGALGALGGGLAGNRIAGRGDRLEGTLLGSGLGGVAGAALGSAIGAESGYPDRTHFCEDYLTRYEEGAAGYGQHPDGVSPYGSAPVVWVRVPIVRERRHCGCEEVEEWIEEEVTQPARPVRRAAPRPDKRVRYAK